ncbi:MAG: RnfABCDGE type electron transport complex subunit D [Clostridium sp.]|nr:RnfABCDGE type electron transport complex subunit D [Clostridium sp.]
MEDRMVVSSSPHIRDKANTQRIMIDVVIALLPAVFAGVYFFGARVLLVVMVSILSCVVSEFLSRRAMKRNNTISDFSAVVTGLLLALNLPPTIPLWVAAVGSVIAIVIIKQLFGGLGQNFVNPAMGARIILMISYPGFMTNWAKPGIDAVSAATSGVDAISTATPLGLLKEGALTADLPSYADLFWGNVLGCIGETSAAALLIGAVYLFARRIISPEIPLAFIGTTALFTWIFGGTTPFTGDFLFHILAGGLLLGAIYMATDYATSPMTVKGRIIMGIGCGLLTGVIRLFTNYAEGVSFAIILMNIMVPLIDRYTIPKSFGGEKAVA